MSNLSAFAPHFLSTRCGSSAREKGESSEFSPSSSRLAADSRFQFDPLLRSTFGHRSVDLYGSQIEDDVEDADSRELADGSGTRRGTGRRQHGSASSLGTNFGASSLLNASRYGPSISRRNNGASIPEIEDEEYDDDDQRAADEQEEQERRWGRGIHVRQLQQGIEDSTGDLLGSDETDRQLTPDASYVASKKSSGGGLSNRNHQAASAALDPFEVDDEVDQHMSRSVRHPPYSASERANDSASFGGSSSSSKFEAKRPRDTSPQMQTSHGDNAKGKAKASDSRRFRDPSAGRGWMAHSTASAKGRSRKSTKPLRDAYSIYDDDDDDDQQGGLLLSDDDEQSTSEVSDGGEAKVQAHQGYDVQRTDRRRTLSTSTIHYPTRLTAASFLDQKSADPYDNFYKKIGTPSPDLLEGHGTGAESTTLDTYRYPTAVGSSLSSWKPWVSGNNPSWREWRDQSALVVWILAVSVTFVLAGGASIGVSSPTAPSSPAVRPSPYYTLTRSLPLLILLSCLSLGMAVLKLAFLRNLNRLGGVRILRFSLVFIPIVLTLVWAWAFAGSFLFDDEQWSGGSWSTLGLRGLSILPLLLAVLFSRLLYVKRNGIARSLSVLTLSAEIISAHPSLLLLSLLHILVFLAISAPFMTIFIRLFLLGHFSRAIEPGKAGDGGKTNEWITDSRARVLAWATLATWLWTWAALRGIMRVVVSSVVSHWYFFGPPSSEPQTVDEDGPALNSGGKKLRRGLRQQYDDYDDDEAVLKVASYSADEESEILGIGSTTPGGLRISIAEGAGDPADEDDDQLEHRNPTASDLVRASFLRATGPSFGTILLSALLLALSRALLMISWISRTFAVVLSSPQVPAFLHPLAHLAYLVSGAGGVIKGVSDYTLVYTGITGQGFWTSSRRCSRLIVKRGAQGVMEGLIIGTILSLLTISLSLLAALAGFLFSAHQLHVPSDAPLVGLLCGVVPYWTLRLAADVLGNGADALYLCYAIDDWGNSGGQKGATGQSSSTLAMGGKSPAAPRGEATGSAKTGAPASGSEQARKAFETRGSGGWGGILPF